MEYIITTDTHFEHKNILEFAERPMGFEQFILNNLERHANNSNILIHLGDISWKNDRFWNRQLTSMPFNKKWLIRGNHDKKSNEWYLMNGWDFVGEYLEINNNGKIVSFSHKPREIPLGNINIHGHFHNVSMERIKKIEPELYDIYNTPNHILLYLEHDYEPFKLSHLINGIQNGNR